MVKNLKSAKKQFKNSPNIKRVFKSIRSKRKSQVQIIIKSQNKKSKQLKNKIKTSKKKYKNNKITL